jgi:PAS domain S-box-containing protein
MLDVIERQYAEVVTLRTLSATVGRQPAYLGRLFRQQVGSTARDYLTRVRLEHAATLIREGVKIEAVALSVGYRSKKNFYQQFRKRFGTTPMLFRADSAVDRPAPQTVTRSIEDVVGSADSDTSSTAGTVAAIIRASHRAWRLAIRAQRLMVQHFNRFRLAMLLTDDQGRYVGANSAALAVTGYSCAELQVLPPSALFIDPLAADVRCVWQLLIVRDTRPGRPPNATVRTKTGDHVAVHLVTLRNFLWGRSELSTILDAAVPG